MTVDDDKPRKGKGGGFHRKSAARLAAVQALYQIELNDADVEGVILEFMAHRLPKAPVDTLLFSDVVRGAVRRREEIDARLRPALAVGWPLDRLEAVLRAILRCGVYELLMRPDVPARPAISEYVNVAHAFFAGDEPGFVNGVLNRIARDLRPHEFEGRDDGRGAQSR
jgi:N utilization substance protein B